jgi:hypothetical protein
MPQGNHVTVTTLYIQELSDKIGNVSHVHLHAKTATGPRDLEASVIYENQIWKTQGIDDETRYQILNAPPKEIFLQDGEKTAIKMVASTPNTEGFMFRLVTRQNMSYASSLNSAQLYPAFLPVGNMGGITFMDER